MSKNEPTKKKGSADGPYYVPFIGYDKNSKYRLIYDETPEIPLLDDFEEIRQKLSSFFDAIKYRPETLFVADYYESLDQDQRKNTLEMFKRQVVENFARLVQYEFTYNKDIEKEIRWIFNKENIADAYEPRLKSPVAPEPADKQRTAPRQDLDERLARSADDIIAALQAGGEDAASVRRAFAQAGLPLVPAPTPDADDLTKQFASASHLSAEDAAQPVPAVPIEGPADREFVPLADLDDQTVIDHVARQATSDPQFASKLKTAFVEAERPAMELPTIRPQKLWANRPAGMKATEFVATFYASWIEAGVLTLKAIGDCDPDLAKAYSNRVHRHPDEAVALVRAKRSDRIEDPQEAIDRVREASREASARRRASQRDNRANTPT